MNVPDRPPAAGEARQQPVYPDPAAVARVTAELRVRPPLVAFAQVDLLARRLAEVQAGQAVLVQAGDCAESFARASPGALDAQVVLVEAMAARLGATGLPCVAIGRIAGQYAKPRSEPFETRGDVRLPAWRGDIVNGAAFDRDARRPDPARMLAAYARSAEALARIDGRIFAGHEALLLPYEGALVRRDPASGRRYAASAHFLWVGQRTAFEGSAHVEFLAGLANPIGLKCGPDLDAPGLLRLLDRLDPERRPGRVTLIARMGAEAAPRRLPALMAAVKAEGRPVLWVCDPMHGNTRRGAAGRKLRLLASIHAELAAFMAAAGESGVHPGGLHVEATAEAVEECGPDGAAPAAMGGCDPRLNREQALDLAAAFADRFAAARARGHLPSGELVG